MEQQRNKVQPPAANRRGFTDTVHGVKKAGLLSRLGVSRALGQAGFP